MNTNFIKRYYNPLFAAGAIASAGQTALGLVQTVIGDKKMEKYLSQLKPYSTPDEIYKIVNASTARAASGLSPDTLQYLTGQVDRGFASSVSAATRLGADPNELSALLDQKIDSTLKIGIENQLENIKNFDRYIQANNLLADNKAAEQKSQQDLIKDKLQAAQFQKESGLQNIGSGINSFLGSLSANETAKLYKTLQTKPDILSNISKSMTGGNSPYSASSAPGISGVSTSFTLPGIGGRSTPDVFTPEELIQLLNRINNRPQ